MTNLPLASIRVLEIAEGFAGPYAGTLLGDLGAEVIKVEAMQRMDHTRGQVRPRPGSQTYPNGDPGPRPWNTSQPFVRGNRNKLGFTVDLSRPWGIELLKELVRVSDVVLTNMVTGIPEKLGIDYERLREVRPDLIMLTSCGFGHSGPYARFVAMAGSMDAISGHLWLRNYEGEEPTTTSYIAHTDAVNALTSAFAVTSAVYHRRLTGRGQHLDVSGCEAMMPHLGEAIVDYTMHGRVRASIGNRHPSMAPHGVYPAAGDDRWIAIACRSQNEWEALCGVASGEPWTADDRFRTVLGRWRRHAELDEAIGRWTANRDGRQLMNELQEAGIAAAVVLSNEDVLADPHMLARGFFETIRQADLGEMKMAGLGWRMSRTQGGIRLPPPLLGEHNAYVYEELLGLSDPDLARLEEEQYAGTVPFDLPV